MAYIKNIWVDQDVERPKTYEVTNNQDGSITLTDSFGLVTELGTPVNEVNMNHIEDGIDGCAIRKHNLTETFALGEWVLGGTGDDEGIYKSLIANNVGNAITDDDAWEKVELGGGGYEIGDVIWRLTPTKDGGKHLLDGTLIDGSGSYSAFVDYIAELVTDYPDLFVTENDWQTSVTTYGVCGKFVYDSTNNTVRLPKITGIIEGTIDATALGDLVEAGLPNIEGTFDVPTVSTTAYDYINGCARQYTTSKNLSSRRGSSDYQGLVNLNASRSSSIYGNSSTVQPQTIKGYYYIVIANSTKTDIQVDIDNVLTDLNGKADVDLTNVNDAGYIKMAGASLPSTTKYVDLTLLASGSTYTAPADGFIQLRMVATGNTNCGFNLYSPSQNLGHNEEVFQVGAHIGTYLEVQKGQTYGISYWNATGELFRFIYAKGSESEAQ